MHKQITKIVPAGLVLAFAMSATAQEADTGNPEEELVYDEFTTECITLRNLRRTDVIDDRNVLFYMRGRTVYHNILPRPCGGLAREDRFTYSTQIGRLCRLDHIRVLYDDPFGMREGNVCSLGIFHKMDREDARALKEGLQNAVPEANPLPLPPPEEIGDSNEVGDGNDDGEEQ